MSQKLVAVSVPCPSSKPERERPLTPRMTHTKDVRCPFVADDYQWERQRGTCCTFDVGDVADCLRQLDEPLLARDVTKPKSAEQALRFAEALGAMSKLYNFVDAEAVEEVRRLDTVAAAAEWYQQVGTRGFSVVVARSAES